MIKADISKYRVNEVKKLSERPTYEDFGKSENKLENELIKTRCILGEFQDVLYAHGKYSVLICLQGMDSAGKDSLIREVFKDFNISGVEVTSFKVPTDLELKHNYLWRHYIALPAKGKFGVFNRTHYENVLVTRVHPQYIMAENIPGIHQVSDIDQKFWDKRFEQIVNFEQHLAEHGTLIFKFFLHLSREEQRKRLLRRLEKRVKNWKFSPDDLEERELWDSYQKYYEEAINRTSTPQAPWFVIPADNKTASRLIVTSILLQELTQFKDIKEPELSDKVKANLEYYKELLEKGKV